MKTALLAVALFAAPHLARADDVTQAIDSPIAPGSGITLTANQSQTTLTFGFQQQFGTVWDWNAAIEGSSNGSDTVTVLSRSGGTPGTTLRFGLGYSGARAKSTVRAQARCEALITEYKTWNATNTAIGDFDRCVNNVNTLRQRLGLPAASPPRFEGIDASLACDQQVTALLESIESSTNKDEAERLRAAVVAAHKQLLDSRQAIDTSGIEAGLYGSPHHTLEGETHESCEDIARDVKAIDADKLDAAKRRRYDTLYGIASEYENDSSGLGGPWLRLGLSGYVSVVGGNYHPVDAMMGTDLSRVEPFIRVLPALSLDGAVNFPDKIIAISLGAAGSIEDTSTRVCHRAMQGEYYTDDCSTDYLGRPERQWRAYAAALLSLPALATFGNFNVGLQLSGTVVTSGGAHDLFGSGSWRYKVSLPVFLTTTRLPWGMAVGIAPEMSKVIDADQPEDLRLVFFVGARPKGAS